MVTIDKAVKKTTYFYHSEPSDHELDPTIIRVLMSTVELMFEIMAWIVAFG
jgi:hypothetical protein